MNRQKVTFEVNKIFVGLGDKGWDKGGKLNFFFCGLQKETFFNNVRVIFYSIHFQSMSTKVFKPQNQHKNTEWNRTQLLL